MGTPELFLPLLLAASLACRVYGLDVTFHPNTLARLALENLPPSTQLSFHLIHTSKL